MDTVSGLYLVKEWHDEHKKLCLGMSMEMEGFFRSFWGSGVGTSALVRPYGIRRSAPLAELQITEAGL